DEATARDAEGSETWDRRQKPSGRTPPGKSSQEAQEAVSMSTESSSKKGFRPSRLLKLSSSRTASKQSSAGRQRTLSPGKQTLREDQLPRSKIAPPTGVSVIKLPVAEANYLISFVVQSDPHQLPMGHALDRERVRASGHVTPKDGGLNGRPKESIERRAGMCRVPANPAHAMKRTSPPPLSPDPLRLAIRSPGKSSLRATQLEDADPSRRKPSLANGNSRLESKNPRGITRRHTLGGPHCPADSPVDAPTEAPTKEPADMNRKREAFLEHLKQKYPHHASTIMGHQERLHEQSRNCQPPAGDQVDHISAASLDSLDAMSEGEVPPGLPAFTRGSRTRASLPVVRSTNQTRDRSLGMVGDTHTETHTHPPAWKLQVPCLTPQPPVSPSLCYLITSSLASLLVSQVASLPNYGDETKQIHMPNEITSLDTILALFVSAFPQHLSMKMLESPTVAVYIRDDARNMYYELMDIRAIADQTCLKVYHRDPTQAFSRKTHSSNGDLRVRGGGAALERQGGVISDEGSTLSPRQVQQTGREGQPLISPPVARALSPPNSSSRIPFGPRGSCGSTSTSTIQRDRLPSCTPVSPGASAILERRDVKPDEDSPAMLSPLADVVDHRLPSSNLCSAPPPAADPAEHPSLYRQKSRRHGDSQLPTLGTRTPPSSPHKTHQSGALERVTTGAKIQSGVTSEFSDPQTRERMKAMEKQIASLTGLVQHALFMGPNAKTAKATNSEKSPPVASPTPSVDSAGGSPDPVTGPASLRCSLLSFSRSVSDLRRQLQDLRQLQVAESLSSPLNELERSVEDLKESCENGAVPRPVTLQEVEDCAVHLRSIGEALATLRTGFPALQAKMRAVLRVEVEAVRFLKEEPHKLESMMKRVKILTERLGTLKTWVSMMCVMYTTENALQYSKLSGDKVAPMDRVTTAIASEPIISKETPPVTACASPPPPLVLPEAPASPPEPCSSPFRSEVVSTSPVVVHRTCSSPVHVQRSQHSADLSCHSQDPPRSTKSSPSLRKHSAADSNGSIAQGQFVRSRSKAEQRAASIALIRNSTPQAAQLEWEEQQQNLSRYTRTEFDKLLQEAQDSLMMSVPSLEVTDQKAEAQATPPVEAANTPPSVAPPPEETPPLKPATEDHAKSITDTPTEGLTETPTQPSLENGCQEQGNKSPPPPPPRRTHPPGSGLTTGRSGEVIYKTRKDLVAPQEEGEAVLVLQSKCSKTPPKPVTPPPIAASAIPEDEDEDDEGDRIMAELQRWYDSTPMKVGGSHGVARTLSSALVPQVFQKCTIQDVEPRFLVESPLGELWPGEDEVLYYDTDKVSKEQLSPGKDDPMKRKEGAAATSVQVHSVNVCGSAPGIQQRPTGNSPAASGCPWVVGQSRLPRAQRTYRKTHADSLPENTRIQEDLKTGSPTSTVQSEDDTPVEKRGREQERSTLTPIQNPWSGGVMTQEGTKSPTLRSQESTGNLDLLPEALSKDNCQVAVLRSSRARVKFAQEAVVSPALPCEEATSTSDNIAFKITDTEVQALSFGEYEEIMSTEGGNIQTVKVSEAQDMTTQEKSGLGKKPVIIILDEPMDIRSAYKRLSTIFEGEEEQPDQRLVDKRIEEVPEENDSERDGIQVICPKDGGKAILGGNTQNYCSLSSTVTHHHNVTQEASSALTERVDHGKQDPKKKFRLKFPKKKLTALSQAIRTGTKTGKKTLQVVVYEDEEEPDGTMKMAKEAKRFEIGYHRSSSDSTTTKFTECQANLSGSQHGSDEFCKSASLEQTNKQLEASGSIMCPLPTKEVVAEEPKTTLVTLMEPIVKDMVDEAPVSPNEATSPTWKAIRTPQPKFRKPKLPPRPTVIPHSPTKSHQNTSLTSAASLSPSTVPRAQPAPADKAVKQQKFLDPQRQFQQANGSAGKAVGDAKAPSPAFPAFKIPAFDPSSGKSSSPSAANPDATNLNSFINNPAQTHHSTLCLTQPFPAGSPRLPSSTTRSFKYQPIGSAQSQNGQLQPSSSPVSSPTMSQGVKTISAQTTSFTCYKLQGRNGSKAI
ncbi:sickle tail protein-like, partial [Scleropages formosus]